MQKRFVPLLLAILSASLGIVTFPRCAFSWFAFVSFVPLLLLLPFHPPGKLFLFFALSGFLFHLGNLYWIFHVIQHYTTLNDLLSAGILVLLCVVLSLFWGIFGLILGRSSLRAGIPASLLMAPFLWITLEWLRNHLTQFPWCLLGDSQFNHLRIAQLASFFGVYGISGLLMAANSSLALLILRRRYYYFCSTLLLLGIVILYGNWRIHRPLSGDSLTVGCVQGNIPQDVKLNYEFAEEVNRKQLQMTTELVQSSRPDLIFWSEASALFPLRSGGEWTRAITEMARKNGIPMVLGSDSFRDEKIYNTAYLVNARGEIESEYSKMYLVPFGEFVPLRSIFFFAGKVVPEISDFSPGEQPTLFSLGDKKFAIHICFEVVFPQLSRKFCRRGAALLSTITNDAWFGNSSAPYQHFAMAILRAIENRRYLVRAANTGISGIVDPYGRILQQTEIFVPAKISGEVKWIEEQTFYAKYGDVAVYVSFLLVVLFLIYRSPGEKS